MIDLDNAACRRGNPELFHPEPTDDRAVAAARHVCAGCEIRLDCLALALVTPDVQGIWGGMTENERSHYLRKNRPRSNRSQDRQTVSDEEPALPSRRSTY